MIHPSFRSVIIIAVGMCLVHALNVLTGFSLNSYGLYPRQSSGLLGIALSPMLHTSILHLLSNIVPFVVLGWFVSLISVRRFILVSAVIVGVGGILVWLVGRPSIHVGASGWVFGLWGYLIARGWFERSFKAIAVAILVMFFYGSMLFGFLPRFGVSFESHIAGAAAGALAAFLFSRRGIPARP